ncbi:hypothetical protein DFH28DRAFT_1105903 [Melampsora americana]|nr:hypothetical protein DFH28DRAFT_1105903 [Melampsora americana]
MSSFSGILVYQTSMSIRVRRNSGGQYNPFEMITKDHTSDQDLYGKKSNKNNNKMIASKFLTLLILFIGLLSLISPMVEAKKKGGGGGGGDNGHNGGNGRNGENGRNGRNGENGRNGRNGENGKVKPLCPDNKPAKCTKGAAICDKNKKIKCKESGATLKNCGGNNGGQPTCKKHN